MNIERYILKGLKKIYTKIIGPENFIPTCEQDPNRAGELIHQFLSNNDVPCMIARFGSNELACLNNYLGIKKGIRNRFGYIQGKLAPWWWDTRIIEKLGSGAGFFPITEVNLIKFGELMLNDLKDIDVLGSWLKNEIYFQKELEKVKKVRFLFLDPFWSDVPWTRALEGKKVLVVHPFAKTIESQFKKRSLLFNNNLLPDFDLKTIKAVQSIAGTKTQFNDWFEALAHMKSEIDKTEYDICLIGAGAYGFPLAAHVKRMGKKGFHMGGSLQLLFGIRGRRWEENYNNEFDYKSLVNEHWVKPSEEDKPANANMVEGACYW